MLPRWPALGRREQDRHVRNSKDCKLRDVLISGYEGGSGSRMGKLAASGSTRVV
jgi:hypothetical protein